MQAGAWRWGWVVDTKVPWLWAIETLAWKFVTGDVQGHIYIRMYTNPKVNLMMVNLNSSSTTTLPLQPTWLELWKIIWSNFKQILIKFSTNFLWTFSYINLLQTTEENTLLISHYWGNRLFKLPLLVDKDTIRKIGLKTIANTKLSRRMMWFHPWFPYIQCKRHQRLKAGDKKIDAAWHLFKHSKKWN